MQTLINFHQITPLVGTSGYPSREQFRLIADNGYQVVVNLAMHNSDDAIADEGAIVAGLGMSYFHLPVPFDAPTPDHLAQFFAFMEGNKDRKVLVHCQVNARVSAFMHQYLTLTQGYSSEEATSPLLKLWHEQMDDVWKDLLSWPLDKINTAD